MQPPFKGSSLLRRVAIRGQPQRPTTGRTTFTEVIQEATLRRQLHALNLNAAGQPWLDEERLSEAVGAITRMGTHKLMEANQKATELLMGGLTVEGLPGWDGGRGQTIRYIDWDTPANNRFTVVNQYRVDCPPGYNSGKAFIVPDLVLLVNGIPLVVVECKSPSRARAAGRGRGPAAPLQQPAPRRLRGGRQRGQRAAVRHQPAAGGHQLRRSARGLRRRRLRALRAVEDGGRADGQGSEIEVAAARWASPALSEQERLIAGLLRPAHLLDVVKNFMLFMQAGGQTIKSVCRYQQYRAVNRAIARLKTGQTRLQHGEHDQRGGIIWHTQGSGKSLTMVFLVRKMRADAQLRRFKVIVVTDRKDLQRQLSDTATLTGERGGRG
jgi:type I restriction enzyme R subunit